MKHEYCNSYGFDQVRIESLLRLLELSENDQSLAEQLQKLVIKVHLKSIVDSFYNDYLLRHEEYQNIIGNIDRIDNLKRSQAQYLLSLGINFKSLDYFEYRLRVGVAHERVGLSLSLYNCAYRKLREIILEHIPHNNGDQDLSGLRKFVDKIISLDKSLAIESYFKGSKAKLETSVNILKKNQTLLEKKANTDALTHFASRDAILAHLEKYLQLCQNEHKPISVLMIDIDNLGAVNDKFGHLIGDHVMREITTRIQKSIPMIDMIGRFGGDEFLVIFKACTLGQAMKFAEDVRKAIAGTPITLRDIKIEITASMGVAESTADDTLASIISKVDRAMFKAKKSGGNCVLSAK